MKKFYEKFFAHQLEKPKGLFGLFYMKRFLNVGNQRSNELALKHLQVHPSDQVLEIGFGGGWLIQQIALRATEGEFVLGSAENLPFASESFTRVCAACQRTNLLFGRKGSGYASPQNRGRGPIKSL